MHGKQYVHKGIAPENIILKSNGEVMICEQKLFKKNQKEH